MNRATLLVLQLLVAVVLIGIWHVGTSVPFFGVKILPPFFFSTPYDVGARIVKWLREGTIWWHLYITCLLYTSPSPRDRTRSRMPSSA